MEPKGNQLQKEVPVPRDNYFNKILLNFKKIIILQDFNNLDFDLYIS